jgi:phosphate transport system permease protein
LSGAVTTITILLIVVFLFREGFGLFRLPAVESGYALCLNVANPVQKLSSHQIKQIFDYEIENWAAAGGPDEPIELFRLEYEMTPEELGTMIAERPGIIAFLPEEYVPAGVKVLRTGNIRARDFFFGREWIPTATPAPQLGIMPLVLGTLWVSVVAIVIALPLGLGVAIYLAELAGARMRKVLKPTIELLAGIPSVVYGFFGLVVLVPLVQRALGLDVGETGFTGAVILAIMALPTIITVAEDAMRGTPRAMREASLALGATQWQTIRRVVVPYARSGISAAAVLGIGRAVGETMAVLMVTGNAAVMPRSLFEPLRTIPATIAAELGEAPAGGAHYRALFMLGCILFLITLAVSITAEIMSKNDERVRE